PVWEAIESHRAFPRQSGGLEERRRERLKQEVIALVAESAREDARRAVEGDTPVGRLLRDNRNGRLNPYSLAADVRAMRPARGAGETSRRYKFAPSQGQSGLSVALDMPTLMGYDSDDPLSRGEVGHCGVAIDSLEDMETLFGAIRLDTITTSMTINSPAAILY